LKGDDSNCVSPRVMLQLIPSCTGLPLQMDLSSIRRWYLIFVPREVSTTKMVVELPNEFPDGQVAVATVMMVR